MSFDLKIQNGDLVVDTNGDFKQVQDTEKLIQDILKILMTVLGANKFFPWYGSILSDSAIGDVADTTMTTTMAQQIIRSNLETLQKMQQMQISSGQSVTPNELLATIESIIVNRNMVDPTYYEIFIRVFTKGFKTAIARLEVSL